MASPRRLHVGEKYPIITSGYIGNTIEQWLRSTRRRRPSRFEDLGLVIKVTPHVVERG